MPTPKLGFQQSQPVAATPRRDREGKRLLQAHIPVVLSTELRVLAARSGITITALVEEAIADLLVKRGHSFHG